MLCFYITLLYQIYFCTFFLLFMYVSYTKILGQSVTKSPYFHFQYISGLFASSDISHIFFHKNLQLSCPVDNNILLLHCLLLFFVVMKNSHFYKMLTNQKCTQMRKTEITENPAFTFRTFLLRLGLIGPEYKNVRKHLLANLEGDRAWRYDRSTYECLNRNHRTEDVR